MMRQPLPNFLIVGAAKSGTTSLFDQLCDHPEVFKPYIKEPGFFIPQNEFSSISDWDAYLKIFEGSENFKVAGEASVSYLMDPESPDLIKKRLGEDVKILIILRNPIDMAYSLWKHRRRERKEDRTFFEAIKENESSHPVSSGSDRLEYDWDYIGRARYFPQVKRYFESFENVKVVIFEDYKSNYKIQFQSICGFLGINKTYIPKLDSKNQAFEPRFSFIQKILMNRMGFKEWLKKILPHKILLKFKEKVEQLNSSESTIKALDSEERETLIPYFSDDVTKLEKLIDKDLRKYWNDFS